MREFEAQMKQLDELVKTYHKGKLDGHHLVEVLRKMSTLLYYLADVRAEVHNAFQNVINESTKDKKMSVARAENEAHLQYPALYKLRHKIAAADGVVWAVKEELNYIKKSMSNNI